MYLDAATATFVEAESNRAISCAFFIPIGKVFKYGGKSWKATRHVTRTIGGKKKTVTILESTDDLARGSLKRKPFRFDPKRIKHHFDGHSQQWGFDPGVSWNNSVRDKYVGKLMYHMHTAENVYEAIHRGEPAFFYTKATGRGTQLTVITSQQDNLLIGAFEIPPDQFENIKRGIEMYSK